MGHGALGVIDHTFTGRQPDAHAEMDLSLAQHRLTVLESSRDIRHRAWEIDASVYPEWVSDKVLSSAWPKPYAMYTDTHLSGG